MRRSFFSLALTFLAGIPVSACSQDGPTVKQETGPVLAARKEIQMTGNTARPGWIAIKEEFDAAMKTGTVAALELFIARHPDSQWTDEARRKLASLKRG